MQGRAVLTALAGILIAQGALAAPPGTTTPPATPPGATPPPATTPPAPQPPTAPTDATAPATETSGASAAPEEAAAETPTEPATEPPAEEPPLTEPAPAPPPPEPAYVEPVEQPPAKPPSTAGPFAKGSIHVGGTIGLMSSIGGSSSRTWFILGVGAGYFFLDGLEAHGDTTFWIGDPFVATLTPGVRYVFHMVPVVKPYVGTFYRHYFVTGDLGDSDSLGARGGVNFMLGPNSYVAGGVVYEHFLDDALFPGNPDQLYPEITIAIAF